VTSLNIGKDHAYYLMDKQKRIDLQHGDILNLGDYKVRVSLISKQQRSENDQLTNKSGTEPRRDFSMQFDHMVNAKSRKSCSQDMSIVDSVANSRIEKMHHLVPSKSSFAVPKYIKQQKKQQVTVKSKQCHEASQSIEAKEAVTIQVKQRHIDHMFEYYQLNKESKSD
jgi:predicted component of type VI protein secretion system